MQRPFHFILDLMLINFVKIWRRYVKAGKNESSFREVFCKKGALKNFTNFIKKETPTHVFSCIFCEIFKNTYFYRTPSEKKEGGSFWKKEGKLHGKFFSPAYTLLAG